MKIHWEIVKKRGNHRPVLKYEIELESFEIDLAVPQVVLDNAIPKPPSAWRSFCYPGEDERSSAPLDWYRLISPSHKSGKIADSLTLGWRAPSNTFDDVQAAFELLRHDFELTLQTTYDSAPLEIVENIELTEMTRNYVASGVAKAKILAAVGF